MFSFHFVLFQFLEKQLVLLEVEILLSNFEIHFKPYKDTNYKIIA